MPLVKAPYRMQIYVDETLRRDAKAMALMKGKSLSEFVSDLIWEATQDFRQHWDVDGHIIVEGKPSYATTRSGANEGLKI